jgi:eukaryotic-like serine/threonine-protein kinase
MKKLLTIAIKISLASLVLFALISLYFVGCDRIINADSPVSLKWRFKAKDPILHAPVVVDDVVYMGEQREYLYAIDKDTGKLKWKFYEKNIMFLAPSAVDGVVYVGRYYYGHGGKSYLYAINAATGELKWRFETGDHTVSSPKVFDGMVYIVSANKILYAVDAKSGELKWRYRIEDILGDYLSVADGVVYINGNMKLYAIDVKSGELKWQNKITDFSEVPIIFSPSVSDGVAYMGGFYVGREGNDCYFYAIDSNSGVQKWRYKVKGPIYTSTIVVDDVIYFGGRGISPLSDYLYALEIKK